MRRSKSGSSQSPLKTGAVNELDGRRRLKRNAVEKPVKEPVADEPLRRRATMRWAMEKERPATSITLRQKLPWVKLFSSTHRGAESSAGRQIAQFPGEDILTFHHRLARAE